MALDDYFDVSDARISTSDVLGGGFTTELESDDVEEYVIKAHSHVDNVLKGHGLNDKKLALIELDLARHLIQFGPERQVDSEGAGPSSRDYSGEFSGPALQATTWGQSAMDRDPTDRLGRTTIGFRTVGGSDETRREGREYF